jgi:hypothetical protein
MTWGQLRFQLLQTPAGTVAPSLDLLDAWLNGRYEQVLEAGDWTGIRARTTLETQAAYQSTTDTVTLTAGSTTVTGAGTVWTTAGTVGQGFYRPGDTALYTVVAWSSATSFSLDRPYEGGTTIGAGYVLMRNMYPLPFECKAVEAILDPATGFPLKQFTQAELDQAAGIRTLVGDPECWAEIEDSIETPSGATVHVIELYPPPRVARGYTVEYLRAAYGFNGTNLAQSPLPFVSQAVLLAGVRADIALWHGKMAQAQGYEAQFEAELHRLLMVEHTERRAKPSLRMAARFTRHRMARVTRGYANNWGVGAGKSY